VRTVHVAAWIALGAASAGSCGDDVKRTSSVEQPAPGATPAAGASYLQEHARTRGFTLGRPVKPRPAPDGASVLFLRSSARDPTLALHELDVAAGRSRVLLAPGDLLGGGSETVPAEEKARRERMRVSLAGFTDFALSRDGRSVLTSLSGRLWILDRASGRSRELDTGPGTAIDPRISPDGSRVSYVSDHDLYVAELASGRRRRLTRGGSPRLSHGLAEFVAQEEMGRMAGSWWSPDSRTVLYEEADNSIVEVWHLADPARPGQPPARSFYPRPGRQNARVRVGLVSVTGGATTWVAWDRERFPYLTTVRWEEHGPLTLGVQSRDQKEASLLVVDPASGSTSPLLPERDRCWVPVKRDVPRWLAGGETFLWRAEADGEQRLELRDASGRVVRVVLAQRGGHMEVLDVDRARGRAFLRASTDPTEQHVWSVDLASGRATRLTREPGVHTGVLSKDMSVMVLETVTAGSMPAVTVRAATDGRELARLPSVAAEPPFVPRTEFTRAGDGRPDRTFHAVVVRPRSFDARLSYPVIVDAYGGPGHNKVQASMPMRLIDQWLADAGFLVVSIDNRGTPGRGRDWERPIYRRLGDVPLSDQVDALRAIARERPEMDLERVGIVGWSFGGYLAALAVMRRPDVFRAAVAGAPVCDWLDYDTHYTERYMGLPDRTGRAYREASLLTHAQDLSRPLLLLHGTADDNVFFVHSLKLAEALFRAGRDFQLVPLSGLTHMVPDPVVTERLWTRILGHFQTHLGRPRRRRARHASEASAPSVPISSARGPKSH
jgi:dipeptidyl-peptidase-4